MFVPSGGYGQALQGFRRQESLRARQAMEGEKKPVAGGDGESGESPEMGAKGPDFLHVVETD